MPVILGRGGPSLGGFVCPMTIAKAELWKLGQLKAGDTVRFRAITLSFARDLLRAQEQQIASLAPIRWASHSVRQSLAPSATTTALLRELPPTPARPSVAIRQDGDCCILIEYGSMVLDLALRFRVQPLMDWFAKKRLRAILQITPGDRTV